MLQPLQLKEVSVRYANEIAELRNFFLQANCAPETAEALHAIADRVQRDRAFHRDLTSHIWVVIHSRNRVISYADLLGMLAIAVAGAHFAAGAHEDDAHNLLLFVMEARQCFDSAKGQKDMSAIDAATSPGVPLQPVETQVVREQILLHPQARPFPAGLPSLEVDDTNGSRKRLIWIAACALASLPIGLVLHYRTATNEAGSQASAAKVATETPAPMVENTSPSPHGEDASTVAVPSLHTNRSAATLSIASRARSSHKPLAKNASIFPDTSASPSRVMTSAVSTTPRSLSPASNVFPSPVPYSESTPAPAVTNIPVITSATRLGSSSRNSSVQDFSSTVRERQAPHLLHRTPEEQAELVAELRSPDIATSKISSNATASVSPGTVQAVSLGTNAANVLYSPTPAYPAAAAAAHVEGEVKLEANVDSKGNVASVRVISGPPLLREAALDAAQRWRYRPNVAAGERIPMNAITVFEFQLP